MEKIKFDIDSIKDKFYDINVIEQDGEYIISGEIILDHIYNDVRMTGTFCLEITMPRDYPLALPIVKETSNIIDKNYPHYYADGQLCLASNLELKLFFAHQPELCIFIDKYIIPYLYSYKFYEEYGVYPFGERSHGCIGDLEYLKELFSVDDWTKVFKIMSFILNSSYRGNLLCPCGSGKRLKKCHGNSILKVINAGLKEDCMSIMEEINKECNKKETI